jgi:hypothetical protein
LSTVLPQSTTSPVVYAGQNYLGGYFTLFLLSSDSNFAYYQLYYSYFVHRNVYSPQTCCDPNTILSKSQIGFPYNTPEYSLTCSSGCKSSSNTSTLGAMGGFCNTFSIDESITVITSSYSIVGALSSQSFQVTNVPQNPNVIDWIPLSVYFDNLNGFQYRLYNSMAPRADTRRLNNPPLIVVDPIFTIHYSYERWVSLSVYDSDEDIMICTFF